MGYSYATVEAALAELYRAKTEAQRRTLRARINHLQRLAVIDAAPGKGTALAYEQDHIWRWMFCLELAELGIPPATAAGLVATYWKRALAGIFRDAHGRREIGKPDDFLYIRGPALMSAAWNRKSQRFPGVPHMGAVGPSDMGEILKWLKDDEDGIPPRVSLVNLTARLHLLDHALNAAQKS